MDAEFDSLPPRRKVSLKVWIRLFVVVVAALVSYKLHTVFNQSAAGSVESGAVQQQNGAVSFNAKPVTVQSAAASFQYPSALKPLSNDTNSLRQTWSYGYTDIKSWRLSVAVAHSATGDLTQDSSYQLRTSKPDTYVESSQTYGSHRYTIMTDRTAAGFSKVAYLVHGQDIAEISLYGNDANGLSLLQQTFTMVLQSWQWHG